MIDLHRLTFLRELAAHGTITATAEALAYTPSAISQQLATLEKEIGVPLLERRGRRVVLTAAGHALVDGAGEVFAAVEHATSSAQAAGALLAGPVHVGSFASVGATVIPSAFAVLQRSHPDIELHFRLHEDEGVRELKLGNLDIWVDQHYSVLPGPDVDGLTEHALFTEPSFLAVPTATDRGPDLSAYRDEPWVGGRNEHACGQLLERVTADAGFRPDLRFVTLDLAGILQFVSAGVGVAVLPRLAMHRLPEGVTVHPLPDIERRVMAFTRSASVLRPTLAIVLDELRRAGDAIAADPPLTGSPRPLRATGS